MVLGSEDKGQEYVICEDAAPSAWLAQRVADEEGGQLLLPGHAHSLCKFRWSVTVTIIAILIRSSYSWYFLEHRYSIYF
jgi:hypothetical protein